MTTRTGPPPVIGLRREREVLTVARVPSNVEFQLDIDPYNML